VFGVAVCAINLAVGAGIVCNLFNLFRVAGITCRHIVLFAKNDIQGLVGVLVTFHAPFEFKVGLALMAFGALWYYLFRRNKRRMASFVTIETSNCRLVFAACFLIFMDYLRMALDTVTVL
jgi:hypothetical protein